MFNFGKKEKKATSIANLKSQNIEIKDLSKVLGGGGGPIPLNPNGPISGVNYNASKSNTGSIN